MYVMWANIKMVVLFKQKKNIDIVCNWITTCNATVSVSIKHD